ncbi:SAGA-associated factor 73 [Leucoagaricus sp. SymC.cos]|nr:SAGA-associated factor 73 [Leucoagaricus sp. SymC.cos]
MTLKLKPESNPPSPFTWDISPSSPPEPSSLPSPQTTWLSAKDMKLYGSRPLTSTSDIGVVKCKDCNKPILRSFILEHANLCAKIRSAALKNNKLKADGDDKKNSKKRKASPTPEDPSEPQKKKAKPPPKGRVKGPIDYDKQCGVINDKNLPCSRSLTCKSHSMGAKRAVQGRSRPYDELLLEWNRANNPNFVEPVKRETKAEKKEKREREKLEKKRLEAEAAAARGVDVTASSSHKKSAAGVAKKFGKKAAAAAAAVRLAGELGGDVSDDLAEIDSEAELDDLVKVVNTSIDHGATGVPLAVPYDAGSWFVQRRERARVCRDLLFGALTGGNNNGVPGTIGALNMVRSTSMGHTTAMHR